MSPTCRLPETPKANALRGHGELPQLARLRAYRRTAERQQVAFSISERAACAMMRLPCVGCGVAAPCRGHGLTRLRRPSKSGKAFMGPYAPENLAPACSMCNMMKGAAVKPWKLGTSYEHLHRICIVMHSTYINIL